MDNGAAIIPKARPVHPRQADRPGIFWKREKYHNPGKLAL